MIKDKPVIFICLLMQTVLTAIAQDDAKILLQKVNDKLQKANDYSVEANIKVDMPFIRMLPVDVKIYYKQKGKFKVESKNIAVVPRQGFDQASELLSNTNSYTVLVQGEETLNGTQTRIVNVIPLSDTGDVIFGKFWIDPIESLILKTQFTTRSSGTIVTEYFYENQSAFGLPDKMIFYVDAKKFKMPKNITGTSKTTAAETDKVKDNKKGTIIIVLKNYQVNKGIPDDFFQE